MLTVGVPVVFTVLVWWLSTGAVLYVIGRHPRTYPASMLWASALAMASLLALAATAGDDSVAAAYIAFTASLAVWGWHEMSFLTGYVTGPRTAPLPEGCTGSARLMPAIETVIYHELALFLTLVALAIMLLGSPNEVGLWTYAILWVMRLSAKLNVYLGVSNLTENFLPDHLKYLVTYFRHRPMNLLFPFSVTGGSAALALIVAAALDPGTSESSSVGLVLLATLLALAILEHWFLVLPLPADALWKWSLASRTLESPEDEEASQRSGDDSIVLLSCGRKVATPGAALTPHQ